MKKESRERIDVRNRTMMFCFSVFLLFCIAPTALALDVDHAVAKPINLSIGIGGIRQVADLPQYIGVLYKWFVGAAMVIAAFMITLGGFQYVASAGIPKYVGMAKTRIVNGLMGLVLVIGSYVLLNSINPAFTSLQLPDIRKIENIPLPSDVCNDPSIDSYVCGETYKGADGKQPAGKSCIGMGQCKTGKCLDISGTGSEVSFGATKKAPKLSCVNASICSKASTVGEGCERITPESFGADWKAYCNSGICDAAIIAKNGCYAIDVVVDGEKIQKCEKLGGPNEQCTLTPCAKGLLCNKGTLTATCVARSSVAEGEACIRNSECKSGMCNKYIGASLTGGLCAPTGGYKTLTGDARFADCDGILPQMWGEKQPTVCGEGWLCVESLVGADYKCSDLATGSPCKLGGTHCASADDECLMGGTEFHFSCKTKPKTAKPPAGGTTPAAGETPAASEPPPEPTASEPTLTEGVQNQSALKANGELCANDDSVCQSGHCRCLSTATPPCSGAADMDTKSTCGP